RVVLAPVLVSPGEPTAKERATLLLASVRDVTHETALEAQLRQKQRLEAVGQLTAGVAHDFNNLLQAIIGGLQVLQEQPGLGEQAQQCLAVAERAAWRGASLTHRLLAFSRQQALEPVLIRPAEMIAQLAELLQRTLGGRVRVQFTVEEATWPVRADAAQLDACLFNLALNARDAMAFGGLLRLHVGNAGPHEALPADLPPGEYVRFVVADDGAGMSPETLARVFEPFFTTKPIGKGTGLGLPMVQGFARQSGGDVRIESAPGQGTTVSLWLPRAMEADEAAMPARSGAQEQVEPRPARVLVVDDEPTVRDAMVLFLTSAGLKPVPVASAGQALDLLRAGEACDLLVADQSMPDMTGCELIEKVVRLRPSLPTMLVTGYDKVSGLDQIEGRVTLLHKPFERITFLRQVQALLGATALVVAVGAGTQAPGIDREASNVVPFRAGAPSGALA
ncbi:MAG TPA: ATP-binding protein, partial [Acetobacteraceae bacterium]|nr:ATP-binding protein [Acetobacteraceae bacterium]